jgi:TonB-linked SusC/RagA family outer membrane protein
MAGMTCAQDLAVAQDAALVHNPVLTGHSPALADPLDHVLSIKLKRASVRTLLETIEGQSGFKLVYDRSILRYRATFTVSKKNIRLESLLEKISAESDLRFKLVNQNINVRLAEVEERTLSEELADVTITGTVRNEQGEPVPGATVLLPGTGVGTSTDSEGRYTITVPEGSTLVFSFIGMATQTVAIDNRTSIDVVLVEEVTSLDEVIVVGYGTVKKSDLTGSVERIKAEDFANQSVTQLSEMLSGTVAGFTADQSTGAAGGASMEIRGPNSLNASSDPMLVVDGAIYNGSLNDINPNDIETIDVLKDASSAAIFGSRAASGVILITTKKGKEGKPRISFTTKLGVTQSDNERRGLGPEEFVQFRQDYFRQAFPTTNFDFYTNPHQLPSGMDINQWRALSNAPLPDNDREWLSRLRFTDVETENYLDGKTMDGYDYVFRKGLRQEYDLSISGGTDKASYYWSVGYLNNEGMLVGDQYSTVRSRLNADFKVTDWLSAGLNLQFSDRNEGTVPVPLWSLYQMSPYGQMFEDNGDLAHYPHGQYTENPLRDYYSTSLLDKTNSLFSNLYANVKLPFGFNFKVSFQPRYEAGKDYSFFKVDPHLGGVAGEIPEGHRIDQSTMGWMLDNLLTWNKEFGAHSFNVTLLANAEETRIWSSTQTNRNFQPNQQLSYHGLQFGGTPGLDNADSHSTGDALMARLNYAFMDRYLLTTSVRRDGFSAFGNENPHAIFPSVALGWVLSEEGFFKSQLINRLKLRASWGANGNRDIGTYASLAQMGQSLWYDGNAIRVGINTTRLANYGLRWEKTTSLNLGLDLAIMEDKVGLTLDVYDMTTTDLLMNRQIPKITGFSNITSNLGELRNRGIEVTVNTNNITNENLSWKSNFVFSMNRNEIVELFGDFSTYTLLGEERHGDVPDFTNKWFPGQPLDVVWDYEVQGIWQTSEKDEAAEYNLKPGDYKVLDVDGDHRFVDLQDKKFIGYESPRYRLGFRNDFTFLKNFTASVFLRADLGHIGAFPDAMNSVYGIFDRVNRPSGPVPYWTPENPSNEYPGLTPNYEGFGGTLMIYKPMSFVRVQDVSLAYNLSPAALNVIKVSSLQVFGSVRNLLTFTKWPGWDPESGMNPMPKTYTLGIRCSL